MECNSHACPTLINNSVVKLRRDSSTGALQQFGYIHCIAVGQQTSLSALGMPSDEDITKGSNGTAWWITVNLTAAENFTVTINSLRYDEQNSDPSLYFHVLVIDEPMPSGT